MTGTVAFVDAEGIDRSSGLHRCPREDLTRTTCARPRLRIELRRLSAATRDVVLWVMHPERCMESRIYNTIESGPRR